MRLIWTAVVGAGLVLGAACSGKTDGSSLGAGGSAAGTAGTGGQAQCPADLLLLTGSSCVSVAEQCQSGFCVRGTGSWTCSGPCPCPDGWQCVPYDGVSQGCVPAAWAGCTSMPDGGAGSGGTAGTGGVGYGGQGGSTGWGGQGGQPAGGAGGSGGGAGGSGPCGGFPACPTNMEAKFCDGESLLECAAGQSCPTPSACSQFCAGCTCHVAPPINGVLNAGCDTCKSDADCNNTSLKCAEDPMLKGSGAMACVMK